MSLSSWYSLPLEIHQYILLLLSLDEIADRRLSCPQLSYDPVIHRAIATRISKSTIAVTNRISDDFSRSWRHNSSNIPFPNAEWISTPHLAPLLHFAGPHQRVVLSYTCWNLNNVQECLQFVHSLPRLVNLLPLKLHLHLEFDPAIPHVLDLSMVISSLASVLPSALSALSIENYLGDLQLDMAALPDLEALRLINTNVTFISSFENNQKMSTLVVHPNQNGFTGNNPAIIDRSLPQNLSSLHLGHSVIVDSSLHYNIPRNIHDVAFLIVRDTTHRYIAEIIEHSDVPKSSLTYQSGLAECAVHATWPHIQCLLKNEPQLAKMSLFSIKNPLGHWDFSSRTTLVDLKISQTNIKSILLPPALQKLDLSHNNISTVVPDLIDVLPSSLTHLDVSDNPADWSAHHEDFSCSIVFPPALQELRLSNTNVAPALPRFVLPESLRLLHLRLNQISSMAKVALPSEKPLSVDLSCNLLTTINDCMRRNIQWFDLAENRIRGPLDLSQDIDGIQTTLQVLNLSSNFLRSLNDIRLPSTVRTVNFSRCKIKTLENVTFPASLHELSIMGSDIETIRNVTFDEGSQLVCVNLTHNRIDGDQLKRLRLPPSVRQLNLQHNNISSLDVNIFANLPRLTYLSLSPNKLSRLHLNLPSSLAVVDLSSNKIKDLKLRFPNSARDTELAMVDLLKNRLLHFSPDAIGHKVHGVYHHKLTEIDLSENKVGKINPADFPPALISLVLRSSGLKDRYGYDIGTNVLADSYCLGKRIDGHYF